MPGTASMRNRWPAPRQAVALRMSSQLRGKRVQSKFCSSKTIEPTRPGVGVDAHAEHQPAGLRLLQIGEQGDESGRVFPMTDRCRPGAARPARPGR